MRPGERAPPDLVHILSPFDPLIIQRKRQALRFAARHVITVPPGITRLHLAVWYAVRLVRAVPRLLAWLPAGDRMLVGTRS